MIVRATGSTPGAAQINVAGPAPATPTTNAPVSSAAPRPSCCPAAPTTVTAAPGNGHPSTVATTPRT
ncbi:MAG TPA: hypothetical protein VGP57_04370, partial [Actinoplanes sp.]|nr:hypothetical protein [Actinoplanes sp.]